MFTKLLNQIFPVSRNESQRPGISSGKSLPKPRHDQSAEGLPSQLQSEICRQVFLRQPRPHDRAGPLQQQG